MINHTTDKIIDKTIEKVLENNKFSAASKNSLSFNVIDYRRNYGRSNIYADINYKDNFKGDRELLARAGFIYYFK
ncbi:hypothetical protein EII29_09655 [Leptotrichia sp. OH3620_COT-345]|uniref:hypothetical protein n=1 Tax=Leptotrichia sp. OH3620_COT-345 TaxID=2491048 RepID=UPI000F65129B|nr:hypothetical protein [Leptotrichia sp. OH3620_COT-345]RRD38780.1 hypothetical protein EII29_09655 [Leptotrichia sp. OH3620_COT-345]